MLFRSLNIARQNFCTHAGSVVPEVSMQDAGGDTMKRTSSRIFFEAYGMPLVIEIRCRWNDPASRKRKTKTFERKRSALLSTAARQSELTNNYSSRKDASPPTASFPSTLGVTIPRKGSRFSTLLFSLPRAVLTRCTGISSIGDRKSTRLNSSHSQQSRMPSSA